MAQDKVFDWYGGNAPALEGMKADSTVDTVDSYAAEGNIDAGDPVILGTNPAEQVKKAAQASDASTVIGVALHEHVDPKDGHTYPDGKAVSVMTSGDVYVKTAEDVTAGDAVGLGAVEGTLSYIKSPSTLTTAVSIPNAKFLGSGVAGDIVSIRIRN
ncbi:hypothetical protein SAMN02745671_01179 [Anaerovibrio lipolyticus DSM 3074]|uniref:Uncharacterized protein n=1 Tax=Anaerovibrio lipolyticus DSM 3074 TaxID=1120997 RepID=A0A1M6CM80_9FIRM|nr:DUF2190 family protein [Anaerovibrio lipolyticus]SHI62059.1 hypothetical protein SAMN02745671_01179 [Anaerovibrio lipolyticus DSM 3074]